MKKLSTLLIVILLMFNSEEWIDKEDIEKLKKKY